MKNSFDMESFDIEKLERKNIYRAPESFYDEMQNRVMAKCTENQELPHTEAKVFRLNWMYSAAASLVLLLGILFLVRQNSALSEQVPTHTLAINKPQDTELNKLNAQPAVEQLSDERFAAANTQAAAVENLTNAPEKHQTEDRSFSKPAATAASFNVKPANKEQLAEAVIAGFSGNELADLSQNTEQDVCLDLYN